MTGSELLEASIKRVWNERDDELRLQAINELYHPDGTIFEPARAVSGHPEISAVVKGVLADMPEGFEFVPDGPAQEHHNIVIARWRGIAGGEVTVSGTDVARIADERLIEHYFFFDPKP